MFKNEVSLITFSVCFFLLVPANSEETQKKQELSKQINSASPDSKQIPKGMALIPNGDFIRGATSKEAIC